MTNHRLPCIFHAQNDQGVPLLPFQCLGEQDWIWPTHLPILHHKLDQLVGKLTNLEQHLPSEAHT